MQKNEHLTLKPTACRDPEGMNLSQTRQDDIPRISHVTRKALIRSATGGWE
jgi:hypothetical protein